MYSLGLILNLLLDFHVLLYSPLLDLYFEQSFLKTIVQKHTIIPDPGEVEEMLRESNKQVQELEKVYTDKLAAANVSRQGLLESDIEIVFNI